MEVGDTSGDHSRRGAPRMAVAAVTNWSAADDLAFSSHTAVWSPAERQRFAARDGFSAVAACSINTTVSTSFNPDEALDVSKDVVLALFGRYQTAVLRMSGMPVQKDSEKEWKMHRAQVALLEAQGRTVPSGFVAAMWFVPFQYNRNYNLTASPLKVHDLEQWAWLFACWAIAETSDMSMDSEYLHIVSQAAAILVQIQDFHRSMSGAGGPTIPHALRNDIVKVMLRLSTVKARGAPCR
jgi:hypothetical protein